jgi:Bacterial-like globin
VLYTSDRKGNLSLVGIHRNINITKERADQWLYHMEEILNDLFIQDKLDSDSRYLLLDYFTYTAYMLVAATEVEEETVQKAFTDGRELDLIYKPGHETKPPLVEAPSSKDIFE